jgi:hypothetical protein
VVSAAFCRDEILQWGVSQFLMLPLGIFIRYFSIIVEGIEKNEQGFPSSPKIVFAPTQNPQPAIPTIKREASPMAERIESFG